MLKADELKEALHNAVKGAERCGRFCTYGASIDEADNYFVFHNGTGDRDTQAQTVYAAPVKNLTADPLGEKLRAWITDLHSGNRIDLNGG